MSFKPTEIIFCPTSKCNLRCSHCYVKKQEEKLNILEAQNLVKDAINCHSNDIQIERIGFSGGEPFLYLDFLVELCKTTIENDLLFDKIMTNGVWWKTGQELRQTITTLYDSGFDGKIGLSFDSFHEQSYYSQNDFSYLQKITIFIKTIYEIYDNPSMIEIQSVVEEETSGLTQKSFVQKFQELAKNLNFNIKFDTNNKTELGIIWLTKNEYCIPVARTALSLLPENLKSWKDKKWFKDDFCETTGQVLFVHSNGKIAPCCGFANEKDALCIGKITDKISTILFCAKTNKFVNICYNDGLNNYRKSREKLGKSFPGKTQDMCMFCNYLCKKAISE